MLFIKYFNVFQILCNAKEKIIIKTWLGSGESSDSEGER